MIVDTLLPVCTVIFLGKLLKQFNFINDAFSKNSYKILDSYLLPGLIFWEIAQPLQQKNDNADFFIVLAIACFLTYAIIHLYIVLLNVRAQDAALLSQASFRFNAYICLAVTYGFDKLVVRNLCLFIGFGLPIIDFFTILSFVRLSHKKSPKDELVRLISNGIISKPLLPACIIGIIFSAANFHWPLFISNFFNFVIPATIPLALILIGSSLSFDFIRKPHKLPIVGSSFKFIILPAIGYLFIYLFSLDVFVAKIIMIILVLPCSVTFSLNSGSALSRISDYNSVSTMISLFFLSIIAILF